MNQTITSPTPEPQGLPPVSDAREPRVSLPANSCDSHCHIYGPFSRFPLPADRTFTPHEAPEANLRRLHDQLGIERAVIVHSQGHGHDHEPMLAALRENPDRYKGVAVIDPETHGHRLAEFDEAGVCGVRFSFVSHLKKPDIAGVVKVADMVQPYGWHAAVHVSGKGLMEMESVIRNLPVRVVIDHMARPDIDSVDFAEVERTLFKLLDTGRFWLKLSGVERLSKKGTPFDDVLDYMRRLVQHAPERLLWGTDWPHVNLSGPMPNDGDLVDTLADVAGETALAQILVENPRSFFGFS
ncbi:MULTISPECIES: amidohydrolase family protein [unclassified Rhizobium]|uniref:amidohydrolase family protein n=1 Tax=unclassified Rhizobium TaxID=2613769 RepID=UPI00288A2E38|nr:MULTISPECIES: amidohydrolase family protein [unclassified Rhizobium]